MWIPRPFGVCCLVGLCICADIIEHVYRGCGLPVFPAIETISQQARSKIECAAQCSRDDQCSKFRFDRSEKMCYTYYKMVATAGQVYREKEPCPVDYGYQIHNDSVKKYCFKKYLKKVNHYTATTICNCDGAHLVLIEDQRMFNIVNNLVISNAWGVIWVDAYDIDDDKNFTTYRGDALPYLPPGTVFHGDSQLCIRLQSSIFEDAPCARVYSVLCQRDV